MTSSSLDENKVKKLIGSLLPDSHEPGAVSMGEKKRASHAWGAAAGGAPDDADEDAISGGGGSLQEMYIYSRKHLLRIYPAGWRVDSGNHDPALAWSLGASLAALNWQVWCGKCDRCRVGSVVGAGNHDPAWARSLGTGSLAALDLQVLLK